MNGLSHSILYRPLYATSASAHRKPGQKFQAWMDDYVDAIRVQCSTNGPIHMSSLMGAFLSQLIKASGYCDHASANVWFKEHAKNISWAVFFSYSDWKMPLEVIALKFVGSKSNFRNWISQYSWRFWNFCQQQLITYSTHALSYDDSWVYIEQDFLYESV